MPRGPDAGLGNPHATMCVHVETHVNICICIHACIAPRAQHTVLPPLPCNPTNSPHQPLDALAPHIHTPIHTSHYPSYFTGGAANGKARMLVEMEPAPHEVMSRLGSGRDPDLL